MASGRKTWGFVEHSFALTGVAMLGLIFFRRVDSLELNRSGNISEVELEEVFKYFPPNSLVVGLTLMQVAFADVKTTTKARSSAAIAVGRQASSTLFRTELRSSAWTGFLASCLHTLSGLDHLAPLSIGCTRMESAAGQVTSVGAVILLSALIVVSVHPTLAAVAFADVKTTAKARSSAAIAVGRQASSTLFRTELRSSAWTGFLAGCLHTLSGPDHLAPLSIGCTRMESAAGQVTSVGAVILLSALIVVSVHPTLATVAFADVKTTAKARSSAAIAVGRKASSTLFRTELRSSAWTEFVAGYLHTLSGPDHLAPLSIGCTRMESTAGQAIFGIFTKVL